MRASLAIALSLSALAMSQAPPGRSAAPATIDQLVPAIDAHFRRFQQDAHVPGLVYGIVRDARAGGATIFVSSHVLSEVEHICDRVGIVRDGRLATVSTLGELIGVRAFHVEIDFADAVPVDQLRSVHGFEQLNVGDHHATGLLRGSFEPLLSAIAGRRVIGLTSREPSLEEIVLTYYQ